MPTREFAVVIPIVVYEVAPDRAQGRKLVQYDWPIRIEALHAVEAAWMVGQMLRLGMDDHLKNLLPAPPWLDAAKEQADQANARGAVAWITAEP